MSGPYSEQEIADRRYDVEHPEEFSGRIEEMYSGSQHEVMARWLATYDAIRARCEEAEAARDTRESVIKTIKDGIYGHLGRKPRRGYCVIAEVGEMVEDRDRAVKAYEDLLLKYADYDIAKERDAARERVGVLSKFLQEARDEIEEWGAYAPDYFKEKWDLPGVLARFDAALRKEGEGDDA